VPRAADAPTAGAPPTPPGPRIGLILGAGGVVGQAYHSGVLAALENDFGWDPRTASLIVGSSAGSVTGTLLRLGVSSADLASYATESPLSEEGHYILDQMVMDVAGLPQLSLGALLRPWRAPSAALVARLARNPTAFRAGLAAMTLLPTGRFDFGSQLRRFAPLSASWPDDLWICATRRNDGKRVVFGRGADRPPALADAVAASCAIPGYFAPVRVNNVAYIDGGVYSPSNADVVRNERLDLVIAISPMSTARQGRLAPDTAIRWSWHRRLEYETRRIEARHIPVVRFEPGRQSLKAMGINAMATDRSERVVQAAFMETGPHSTSGAAGGHLARILAQHSRDRGR
jgi:NTE family protein